MKGRFKAEVRGRGRGKRRLGQGNTAPSTCGAGDALERCGNSIHRLRFQPGRSLVFEWQSIYDANVKGMRIAWPKRNPEQTRVTES